MSLTQEQIIRMNVRAAAMEREALSDRNGYVKCPICGKVKTRAKLAAHLRATHAAELAAAAKISMAAAIEAATPNGASIA